MWFSDKKLEIPAAKFNPASICNWRDKEGVLHRAKVEFVNFKSLTVGYIYGILLDEPYNGASKIVVKESNLFSIPKEPKAEPVEKTEKKSRKRRTKKIAEEAVAPTEAAE